MRSKKVKELGCSKICRIYLTYLLDKLERVFCLDTILWIEVEDSQALLVALEEIGSYDRLLHTITQIHWLVHKPITNVNKCK